MSASSVAAAAAAIACAGSCAWCVLRPSPRASGNDTCAADVGDSAPAVPSHGVPASASTGGAAAATPRAEDTQALPAASPDSPPDDTTPLALQSPVKAELLEKIDALYAKLQLHEVRDVLDDALTTEQEVATVVQLRQFRASVLFGVGNVKESMGEYAKCISLIQETEVVPEETAEQINQFWAILAALHRELGDEEEADVCLEEAESNGMLRAEAETLGAEIVTGYKEDAAHFQEKKETGVVPTDFSIKVKATTAVQKVNEMEAQDHLEASDRAQATVQKTGVEVQVQVPAGAMPGQQVPCQTAVGMPAHLITIPMDAKAGDTINVKLPKLEDLQESRLVEFVEILTEPIESGQDHPHLISGCLAKRAMHYLLLGRLDDSLADLAKLLIITEHKPVDVDPTAAEAFIMSGFVHRLSVMGCVQRVPPSPEAINHEQKATKAFAAAQQLGVNNLQESIGMMESEIQRAPNVRSIIEDFAKNQQLQQVMTKQQISEPLRKPALAKAGEAKEVKKAIRQGSEAFEKKDFSAAIGYFSKALAMKPSSKWLKWLYKNRAVCYKYTKQWEHMATDARESCTLEPDVPENYLRCAVALKQLGRTTELKAVCTTAEALDMPDKLRSQLATLMAP